MNPGAAAGSKTTAKLQAIKKKILNHTAVLKQAGKTPVIIDIDAFALQNAWEMSYEPPPEEVAALLDIGANDGFFSFAAERAGASRVLAVDGPAWGDHDSLGSKRGFDFARDPLTGIADGRDLARARRAARSGDYRGARHRSSRARAEFRAQFPCPSTGRYSGACPGG